MSFAHQVSGYLRSQSWCCLSVWCQWPDSSCPSPVMMVHHPYLSYSYRWKSDANAPPHPRPHLAHRMIAHIKRIKRLNDASRLGSLKNKSSCMGLSHRSTALCLSIAICFCPMLLLSRGCMSHHLWACVLHEWESGSSTSPDSASWQLECTLSGRTFTDTHLLKLKMTNSCKQPIFF